MDDAELVRHVFNYNSETGEWTWRNFLPSPRGGHRAKIGDSAGTIDKRDGSRVLSLGGKLHRASRVAWLYMTGEWPSRQVIYADPNLPVPARDRFDNLCLSGKREELSQEELKKLLRYDPSTGEFVWIVSKKGIVSGSRAGYLADKGDGRRYLYIAINRTDQLGHRLAWLYVYGRWPSARMVFKDGDSTNICFDNLVEGEFEHGTRQNPELTEEDRKRRQAATYRKADLKRDFGLSVEEYQAMHDAQKGVCAICRDPETKERDGKVKWLAVDHNHETGAVRALLCQNCNHMIGHSRERIDILESAIAYLRAHEQTDAAA